MRTSTFALLSGVALTRADFLTPAGGEILEVDKEVTVQWETEDLVEPLDIRLVPSGGDTGEAQEVACKFDCPDMCGHWANPSQAGIGNAGSVAFTPEAEAGDFELVLTDSEDNTVISDTFSIGSSGDDEDGAEAGANGGEAEDAEASDVPASQAEGLNQVPGVSDENGVEDPSAESQQQDDGAPSVVEPTEDDVAEESGLGSQPQDDAAPPVVEPTEDNEAEGSGLVPEEGDDGVPTVSEPSVEGGLENGEFEVEDGESEDANEADGSLGTDTDGAVEDDESDNANEVDGNLGLDTGGVVEDDGGEDVNEVDGNLSPDTSGAVEDDESDNANEVDGSLSPDTGGAVAGDTGGDDSNAGGAGSLPGSFVPLSGDQLTILPTLSNGAGADAPSQPTEEVTDAVETNTVDEAIPTVPNGLSEAEPTEPTTVASASDGLAVSTTVSEPFTGFLSYDLLVDKGGRSMISAPR